MRISRKGGVPAEAWRFDGVLLRSEANDCPLLILEGLEAFLCLDDRPGWCWRIDDNAIVRFPDAKPLWCLDDGGLHRAARPVETRWRFDGRSLEQHASLRPDRWEATADVPLLVIAFAAGLL